MKRAVPGLVAVIVVALIVGSPYAQSVDDFFISLFLYVGLPIMLLMSLFALSAWWKTQIKGDPPPPPAKTRWKRVESALQWLNWF